MFTVIISEQCIILPDYFYISRLCQESISVCGHWATTLLSTQKLSSDQRQMEQHTYALLYTGHEFTIQSLSIHSSHKLIFHGDKLCFSYLSNAHIITWYPNKHAQTSKAPWWITATISVIGSGILAPTPLSPSCKKTKRKTGGNLVLGAQFVKNCYIGSFAVTHIHTHTDWSIGYPYQRCWGGVWLQGCSWGQSLLLISLEFLLTVASAL